MGLSQSWWTVVVGASILFFGLYAISQATLFQTRGLASTATVVGAPNRACADCMLFAPVEYTAKDGGTHRGEVSASSSTHIGETIPILYIPSDPANVQRRPEGGLGIGGWIALLVVGSVTVVMGMVLLYVHYSTRTRAAR